MKSPIITFLCCCISLFACNYVAKKQAHKNKKREDLLQSIDKDNLNIQAILYNSSYHFFRATFGDAARLTYANISYNFQPWENRWHLAYDEDSTSYPVLSAWLSTIAEDRKSDIYFKYHIQANLTLREDSSFSFSWGSNHFLCKNFLIGKYTIDSTKTKLALCTAINNKKLAISCRQIGWRKFYSFDYYEKNKDKNKIWIQLPKKIDKLWIYNANSQVVEATNIHEYPAYSSCSLSEKNTTDNYLPCISALNLEMTKEIVPTDTLDEKYAQTKWLVLDSLPDSLQVLVDGYKSNMLNLKALEIDKTAVYMPLTFECKIEATNIGNNFTEINAYLPNACLPLRIENHNIFGYSANEKLCFLP